MRSNLLCASNSIRYISSPVQPLACVRRDAFHILGRWSAEVDCGYIGDGLPLRFQLRNKHTREIQEISLTSELSTSVDYSVTSSSPGARRAAYLWVQHSSNYYDMCMHASNHPPSVHRAFSIQQYTGPSRGELYQKQRDSPACAA